ncbi:MAG TPA: TIGR02466 family protein [Polyangiaceae bacterium]
MSIDVIRLFAVPMFSQRIDGFGERRAELLREIDALREGSPGIVASNCGAWHSPRDLHLRNNAAFAWACGAVLAMAREALRESYGNFQAVELRLVDAWALVAPPGSWVAPHHHFPAAWSGVLWIAAEHAAVGPDAAHKAGRLELMSPVPVPESFGQAAAASVTPKDGVVVLFPSILEHFVHPTRSSEPRVSLSFNLEIASART